MKEHRILKVNLLFLVVAILILVLGSLVQAKNQKIGILITEYLLVLGPSLLFIGLVKKSPILDYLGLRDFKPSHIIYSLLIVALLYPLVVLANGIFIELVSSYLDYPMGGVDVAADLTEYLGYIFIIGFTPGLCEEIFLRGVVMKEYGILGGKKALIISSVLFGLIHFNLYNFIGPTILGLVLGYLVQKTGSLYIGILGHMWNNILSVSLGFILLEYNLYEGLESLLQSQRVLMWFFIVAVFIFPILALKLLGRLPKNTRSLDQKTYCKVEYKVSRYEYLPLYLFLALYLLTSLYLISFNN